MNHAPAKFEVAMCKMHLQEIYLLVNASPKPLEIQCMSPTCMHLHFFKFEVAKATSNLEQEMSQSRDECPQRNWSSIRHIRGKSDTKT